MLSYRDEIEGYPWLPLFEGFPHRLLAFGVFFLLPLWPLWLLGEMLLSNVQNPIEYSPLLLVGMSAVMGFVAWYQTHNIFRLKIENRPISAKNIKREQMSKKVISRNRA